MIRRERSYGIELNCRTNRYTYQLYHIVMSGGSRDNYGLDGYGTNSNDTRK
jgi:hypothetical protein